MAKVYLANWIQERKSIVGSFPAHWFYQKHTAGCAERQIGGWQRYRTWVDKWPDYCDKCDGWGVLSWTENAAPFGSGENWQMPMHDVCDTCIASEEMVCPRCGKGVFGHIPRRDHTESADDAYEKWLDAECPCPHCGWEWGNNEGDGAPIPMEDPCGCERGYGELPGKWQRWLFERFGFQRFFKCPIEIMIGKEG